MSTNNSLLYYQLLQPGEESGVVDLATKVFNEFVAPLYSAEGVSEFLKYAHVDELVQRKRAGNFVLLAKSGNDILGIIEVRENNHIAMLFVEKSHQKKGIGKELLKRAIDICKNQDPEIHRITVNSSPNAVSAYRTMGFNALEQEQVANGIRFTPMELSLI